MIYQLIILPKVAELGSSSLSELESLRGPLGLPVERDASFSPTPLRELMP